MARVDDFLADAPAPADAPAAAPTPSEPPGLQAHVDALIAHESGGNPNAVGDSGLARGVGQMHEANRERFGGQGRDAVTATLADSYKRRGNWDDAYSDYHLGQPNYERDRTSDSNQRYLDAVNSRLGEPTPGTEAPASGASRVDNFLKDVTPGPEQKPGARVVGEYSYRKDQGGANPPAESTTTTATSVPGTAVPPSRTTPGGAGTSSAPVYNPSMGEMRRMDADSAGRLLNKDMGLPEDHWIGSKIATAAKPFGDAMVDFGEGLRNLFKEVPDAIKNDGSYDPSMVSKLGNLLQMAHFAGAPVEMVADIVRKEAENAGYGPTVQAALGMASSMWAAGKLMPGVEPKPTGEPPLEAPTFGTFVRGRQPVTPALPAALKSPEEIELSNLRAQVSQKDVAETGQTAKETATEAAARAETADRARAEAERATQASTEAKAVATKAAEKPGVQKGPEAAAQAKAALNPERPTPEGTPGPPTPPVGSTEGGEALQRATKGGAVDDQARVQGEFDDIYSTAHKAGGALLPDRNASIVRGIKTLREENGATWASPTAEAAAKASEAGEPLPAGSWEGGIIHGDQAKLLNEIEDAAKSGAPIPIGQAAAFKRLLDSLLPYKKMAGMPPRTADLYHFKLEFRDAIRDALQKQDPELARRFDTANEGWTRVQSERSYATNLSKKDPEEAFASVFGGGGSPMSGAGVKSVMRQIEQGGQPESVAAAKETLQKGWRQYLINKGTDRITGDMDPKALVKAYRAHDADFVEGMGDKETHTFMQTLDREQTSAADAKTWADEADKYAVEMNKAHAAAAKAHETAQKAADISARKAEGAADNEAIRVAVEKARDAKLAAKAAKAAADKVKPGRLGMFTAKGFEMIVGARAGAAIGHPILGVYAAREFIPPEALATAMGKAGSVMARALKTGVDAATAPLIINELNRRGVDLQRSQ